MKVKVHPSPEGEYWYRSIFSLTSVLERGWVFDATPWPLYARERDLVPTVQEVGLAPGTDWRGAENLASAGKLLWE